MLLPPRFLQRVKALLLSPETLPLQNPRVDGNCLPTVTLRML